MEPKTLLGRRIVMYGMVAGGLLSIFALAATGIDRLPDNAWQDELDERFIELAGSVERNAKDIAEEALDANQLRIYQNLREQSEYTQQQQSIPPALMRELGILQSRKLKLQKRLEN